MKKITFLLFTVTILAACNSSIDGEKATTTESQSVQNIEGTPYRIDTTTTVTWTGFKPTGEHTGIFKVNEGTLLVKDNALAGGSFTIDILSLANMDMAKDPENKGKLEGHLKSPDFFDAQKYPTAKFEITSVEPFIADSTSKLTDATHLVKGNLTLKGITKNISFPAKVTVDANSAAAYADFIIDRTNWGLNYKGPENPQDWVIKKDVNVKLDVKATKK